MKPSELRGWIGKGVVVVEWSDAEEHSDASGMDLDQLPDECPIVTVGRIERVTEHAIFVASEWFDTEKYPTKTSIRHVMQIPVDWVAQVSSVPIVEPEKMNSPEQVDAFNKAVRDLRKKKSSQ